MANFVELGIAVASTAGGVLAFVWWLVRAYLKDREAKIASLTRQKKALQGQCEDLEARLENLQSSSRQNADLVHHQQTHIERWKRKLLEVAQIANHNARIAKKRQEIIVEQENKIEMVNEILDRHQIEHANSLGQNGQHLEELQQQLAQMQIRDRETLGHQGRIWERPIPIHSPAFIPLHQRKAKIISLINLKGGVGKTTLTANLGALLGEQGAKVLMIDLDYQRSLSRLCCDQAEIKTLHLEKRCIQHLLLTPEPTGDRVLRSAHPVHMANNCQIIACSESLEGEKIADALDDAETQLQLKWLVQPGELDVRLLLRKALHDNEVCQRYDYILLDCPPRLSTGCVNALAASDFALIPVMLDNASASHSAPNLLRKLRRLALCDILPSLKILGIVANRTHLHRDSLRNDQAIAWNELREVCDRAWGQPVHLFEAMIRENSAFSKALDRHDRKKPSKTFAVFFEEIKPLFANLIQEMEVRIDHESQNLAAISTQPR